MEKKAKGCKVKKSLQFDPLEVTESLGYKTYRKNGRNSWSKQEDNELRSLLNMALIELGYANGTDDIRSIHESELACKKVSWEDIAAQFKNSLRKPKELRKRWTSSLDPNLKRGKWDPEEDEMLLRAYAKHGSHWLNVASEISGRTEDQCAKRYVEILGPSSEGRLRKWTLEEDLSLVSKVKSYGTKWRRISSELESRPSLTCRNRWRKIITSIVRGQAPPEIVNAVNENRDIDALVNSLRAKEKDKDNSKKNYDKTKEEEEGEDNDIQELNDDEFEGRGGLERFNQPNTNDLPHTLRSIFVERDQGLVDDAPTIFKEEVHQSITVDLGRPLFTDLNKPSVHGNLKSDTLSSQREMAYHKHSPINSTDERAALDDNVRNGAVGMRHNLSTSMKGSTPFAEKVTNITADTARTPISAISDASALVSNNYAKASSLRMSPDNLSNPKPLDHNLPTTTHDLNKNSISTGAQTDWKFTLKDGQGLSISSGSISNSDLVKELIEQAKKFSLKISLHQHIHHHYGAQNDPNCINTNSMDPMASLQPNPINADTVIGSSSGNDLFTNNHYYKASYGTVSHRNDLFTQEPNYTSFDLGPSPQPNDNPDFYATSNPGIHANQSPGYPHRPGTTSSLGSHSTGNHDESSEIGRHRVSHFNYLPATVKPQLGSSDSTRATDLSRLLNPSPGSGNSRRKKKRTRSFPSETIRGTKFRDSARASPSSTASKHSKPSENTVGTSALYEEEGLDFWEYLRSLAGNPSTEDERPPHSDEPYDEEDYDIFCSLFDHKATSGRSSSIKSEGKKNPVDDSDSIIPFNPS